MLAVKRNAKFPLCLPEFRAVMAKNSVEVFIHAFVTSVLSEISGFPEKRRACTSLKLKSR